MVDVQYCSLMFFTCDTIADRLECKERTCAIAKDTVAS